MWHMLNKRLIWKLLRTIGNILCGISWWGGHNWWACCWGWVHHGTLMMLVLPLLGHIWYCRKKRRNIRTQQLLISIKYRNMVHKALHDWVKAYLSNAMLYHTHPPSATMGCFPIIYAIPQPQTPTPYCQVGKLLLVHQVSAWKQHSQRDTLWWPPDFIKSL